MARRSIHWKERIRLRVLVVRDNVYTGVKKSPYIDAPIASAAAVL